MKLEEGMYIRTKYNDFCNMVAIRKIVEIDEEDNKFWVDEYIIDTYGDEQNKLCEEDVSISGYKLIEVLKIRDVITTNNLCGEITKIDIKNNKIWIACCDYETCKSEDIVSIITREQFRVVSYGVGN